MTRNEQNSIKDIHQLEFAVFVIENTAVKTGLPPEKVYSLIAEDSRILPDYLMKNYEVLYTQGKDYIVSDLLELMKEKKLIVGE
ncbi:MAG: DUF3791 domain-containing protein [Erysipelotrichaceae bacterium]|nr:DUF3791 domain-containing protein [Erysipelotrichaceae bacterium]